MRRDLEDKKDLFSWEELTKEEKITFRNKEKRESHD